MLLFAQKIIINKNNTNNSENVTARVGAWIHDNGFGNLLSGRTTRISLNQLNDQFITFCFIVFQFKAFAKQYLDTNEKRYQQVIDGINYRKRWMEDNYDTMKEWLAPYI